VPKQFIRFNPGSQNQGAGSSLFKLTFCRFNSLGQLPEDRLNPHYVSDRIVDGLKRSVFHYTARTTRSEMVLDFDANVVAQDGMAGLIDNPCWPSDVVDDPGFALLTDDPYYAAHRANSIYGKKNYNDFIPKDVLTTLSQLGFSSKAGYRKRDEDLHNLDPDAWVFNDGNRTRRLTDAELENNLGILRCSLPDCKEEMRALGIETAIVVQPTATAPSAQLAPSTTQLIVEAVATLADGASTRAAAGGDALGMLVQPRVTGV